MSSFKNFAPTLRSLQAQADGTGTIAGSPIEDFLSIAGYETPGGGGGGDSDFSTAEVTVNNSGAGYLFNVPVILNNAMAVPFVADAASFTVILYKGTAIMGGNPSIGSVSGDITYDEEEEIYLITGDCTITVLD